MSKNTRVRGVGAHPDAAPRAAERPIAAEVSELPGAKTGRRLDASSLAMHVPVSEWAPTRDPVDCEADR